MAFHLPKLNEGQQGQHHHPLTFRMADFVQSREIESSADIRDTRELTRYKYAFRGPLVSTKLGEPVGRSTVGPFDPVTKHSFQEYNELHDPHLKHYFSKPERRQRLIDQKYITPDMKVVCKNLQEYNDYRRFLKEEITKIKKEKDREQDEITIMKSSDNRQLLFEERKLKARHLDLLKYEAEQRLMKARELEKRSLLRKKNSVEKEIEINTEQLNRLEQETQESGGLEQLKVKRTKFFRQTELRMLIQSLHQRRIELNGKLKHLDDCNAEWRKYFNQQTTKSEHGDSTKSEPGDMSRPPQKKKIRKQHTEPVRRRKLMSQSRPDSLGRNINFELEKKLEEKRKIYKEEWKKILNRRQQQWEATLSDRKTAWQKDNKKLQSLLMKDPANYPESHFSKDCSMDEDAPPDLKDQPVMKKVLLSDDNSPIVPNTRRSNTSFSSWKVDAP